MALVPLGTVEMLPLGSVVAIYGSGIFCDCVSTGAVVVFAYQVDQIKSQFAAGGAIDTKVIPVRLTISPVLVGLALDGAPK